MGEIDLLVGNLQVWLFEVSILVAVVVGIVVPPSVSAVVDGH